jgi:uncharacterized iron-regulated membrane protein
VLSAAIPRRAVARAGLRRAWLWLHRWLGLLFGVILVIVGLTGSVIVFYREIDATLNRALYAPDSSERRITFAQALEAAAAGDSAPIRSVIAPDPVWPVWVVMHLHPTEKGHYPNIWTTMVDPSNGRVLGRRDYTHAFAFTVYRLHFTLLLYDWHGKELVGVIAFILLCSSLSGLYLWWPKWRRFWRSVSLRRGVSPLRLMIDLHNLAGFWTAPLLILVAVTGIGIVFPGVVRPIVGLLSPATPYPSPTVKAPPAATPTLTADEIVAFVRAAKPRYDIAQLNPPIGSRNTWRALLRPPQANPALRTRGAIWLDPWTGAVVHDRTGDAISIGDRYQTEQLWLHNGATLGLVGRILVFISGFVPLVLLVTGLLIWRGKRQTRRTNVIPRR